MLISGQMLLLQATIFDSISLGSSYCVAQITKRDTMIRDYFSTKAGEVLHIIMVHLADVLLLQHFYFVFSVCSLLLLIQSGNIIVISHNNLESIWVKNSKSRYKLVISCPFFSIWNQCQDFWVCLKNFRPRVLRILKPF